MKKVFLVIGSFVALMVLGFIGIYIWIDIDVQKNISIAKEKYLGKAEEALIAYLLDTTNSP